MSSIRLAAAALKTDAVRAYVLLRDEKPIHVWIDQGRFVTLNGRDLVRKATQVTEGVDLAGPK